MTDDQVGRMMEHARHGRVYAVNYLIALFPDLRRNDIVLYVRSLEV